ncbi:GNAT family N-acetyltransferase [Kordiimonas sp. SCSIO 12610]|uniref:GNAT family N-acetyltransferase n=1 Tax=Kordiimonas sp. SCSIO 12610 TaxID=2829597 RepID=UPI00210B1AA0|nr:GNAT family N-acetyltransferase [Kordiimonas sp. SCSIO 12610]UTW56694.1 GNAT family N-acetyltransferase [Kordiimonas sp. SCSIO 12610]
MAETENHDPVIRALTGDDTEALIALIGGCYSEYEGVFLDLDDLDSDLKSYAGYIKDKGGEAFALVDKNTLIGCVAYAPLEEGSYELKRMYLNKDHRGNGEGGRGNALMLLHHVLGIMRDKKADALHAWSDDRFTRAHRFYEREGFDLVDGDTRFLHDISNSTEIHFVKYFK